MVVAELRSLSLVRKYSSVYLFLQVLGLCGTVSNCIWELRLVYQGLVMFDVRLGCVLTVLYVRIWTNGTARLQ